MSHINDSGSRTEFSTGAVRDVQDGKGRFDLIPSEVISTIYTQTNSHYVRAYYALARLYEEGAVKYGDRNWEKGIPFMRFYDSAVRHYTKWARGIKDEPHLTQFTWNVVGLWWTLRQALPHEGWGTSPDEYNEEFTHDALICFTHAVSMGSSRQLDTALRLAMQLLEQFGESEWT